jgi:hypothetical protein
LNNAEIPRLIAPWIKGKCYDFALAVSEKLPKSEFVAVGDPKNPEHVAVLYDGVYYDARGRLTLDEFLTKYRSSTPYNQADVCSTSRDVVELHAGCAGSTPPYKGNRDIAAARSAVKIILGTITSKQPTKKANIVGPSLPAPR